MTSRQKRRKYQWQFLLDFKNWCYTHSLCTENEKSKLISRLSNFTNTFIPPCDDHLSDVDDLFWFRQHAPCYCGKTFCKTAWQIQMPYMDTIRAVHFDLSIPYLCPQYVSFTSSQLFLRHELSRISDLLSSDFFSPRDQGKNRTRFVLEEQSTRDLNYRLRKRP